MSVFTALTANDIRRFLCRFDVGGLRQWQGVPGGSENTNYFLDCEAGSYVLTLVERGPEDALPFLIDLLDHLHDSRLPVPYAVRDREGEALHTLKGRPALLQPRFQGRHEMKPDAAMCRAVGEMLADLHRASATFGATRSSDRDPHWVLEQARALGSGVWRTEKEWLEPVLQRLEEWLPALDELPAEVIHGDLFRDNVLFDGPRISGVIDFYNAAHGPMLLDLAICHNDWCMGPAAASGMATQEALAEALLAGYDSRRARTTAEREQWTLMCQLAALRFWTSRELARMHHAERADILIKDPSRFRRILRSHAGVPA